MGMRMDREQVLRFRLAAQHLNARLPSDRPGEAAAGGLQDTVPRAALFGLHARLDGTSPTSWEDHALFQTYGPRMATYVLPRDGLAAFTRGLLPRDADALRHLEGLADQVVAALGHGELPLRRLAQVVPAFSGQGLHNVRLATRTGRYLIRWDTSSLTVRRNEAPPDPAGDEDARVELLGRFLRWYGPSDPVRFAKWAGVDQRDAHATWKQLSGDLLPVEVDGRERFLHVNDAAIVGDAPTPEAVRLLPPNDAYLFLDHDLVEPDGERRALAFPRYSLPGVVLVDGELVGTWRRQARRIGIDLWSRDPALEARVQAEAEGASAPLGGAVAVEMRT